METGPQFNIKMTSYQYRKPHWGDKTILRPSYLHNGISYTGQTTSLYWIGALSLTFCKSEVSSPCAPSSEAWAAPKQWTQSTWAYIGRPSSAEFGTYEYVNRTFMHWQGNVMLTKFSPLLHRKVSSWQLPVQPVTNFFQNVISDLMWSEPDHQPP